MFKFTPSESYTPIFDQAGYTGSNFIIGIGPMFGTIIFYVLFLAVRKLFTGYIKGTGEQEFCDRKVVPWFEDHNIEVTCLTFILEGNLDISFWLFIAILYVKDHGIGQKFSDGFSNVFAFAMILPLTAAPISLLYRAVKYIKQVNQM